MRLAILIAALPLTASAAPSRTLYLNPCLPNGCTVSPGYDDAKTNRSSIPKATAVLTPWPHGQTAWSRLVQCVRDMYAPFDIRVTDVDPGAADHFELMAAGSAVAVGLRAAAGAAPYIACSGQLQNNVISFVFAADLNNLDYMCWAAAQEPAHVWGLDHALDAKDPMTYLTPPIKKEGFQDVAVPCGEERGKPRECACGGTTQNSYQHLMAMFGPRNVEPAPLTIIEPEDGAWVKPGFRVRFEVMPPLAVATASLQVDGATKQSIAGDEPQVFTTTPDLAGGDHTITVVATDLEGGTHTAEVAVHVAATCDAATACTRGFDCLGGHCLPGADVAAGLGGCSTAGGSSPLVALLGLGALLRIACRRRERDMRHHLLMHPHRD